MYSIKQVAERLNCSPNTIRFYEKKGLIIPGRTESQYRTFTEEDVELLQFILLYRKLGFSVEAVKQMCSARGKSRLDIFGMQYEAVNQQIHSLTKIRDVLGVAVDELLEGNQLSGGVQEQLEDTIREIGISENWADAWNFDNWATEYDADIRVPGDGLAFYKNYDKVMDVTAAEVAKYSGVVVEIGIGTGNLAKCILEKQQGMYKQWKKDSPSDKGEVSILGIDQSLNMLKEAKKKMPEIPLRLGTFLNLPLEEDSCDTIVTSYAFHHCNEEERVLAIEEMTRVLRDEGRIIITDLMFADKEARESFAKNCSQREREDLEDEYFANVDELREIFGKYNYEFRAVQIDELIWMVIGCKWA